MSLILGREKSILKNKSTIEGLKLMLQYCEIFFMDSSKKLLAFFNFHNQIGEPFLRHRKKKPYSSTLNKVRIKIELHKDFDVKIEHQKEMEGSLFFPHSDSFKRQLKKRINLDIDAVLASANLKNESTRGRRYPDLNSPEEGIHLEVDTVLTSTLT
jgi:hypothetical protein